MSDYVKVTKKEYALLVSMVANEESSGSWDEKSAVEIQRAAQAVERINKRNAAILTAQELRK